MVLDFFFITVPISIVSKNVTIVAIAIIGISSRSIISTNTKPIVTIPVSIGNVIVNKGTIFIFTELADKFGLQCCGKMKEKVGLLGILKLLTIFKVSGFDFYLLAC